MSKTQPVFRAKPGSPFIKSLKEEDLVMSKIFNLYITNIKMYSVEVKKYLGYNVVIKCPNALREAYHAVKDGKSKEEIKNILK